MGETTEHTVAELIDDGVPQQSANANHGVDGLKIEGMTSILFANVGKLLYAEPWCRTRASV